MTLRYVVQCKREVKGRGHIELDHEIERKFTVGELAEMVGVSVRTLQYYDKSNILKSTFSEGGRRMYGRDDLLKLQQILFLKSLGFPLDKIKNNILQNENSSALIKVFSQQRDILLHQVEGLTKIVETLNSAIFEMSGGRKITLEKLMTILTLMKEGNPYTFILRYFNEDQMQTLANRFGSQKEYEDFVSKSERLFKRLNELYHSGADPAGAEGQKLAEQWWEMAVEFSRGNQDMLKTLVSSGKDIDNWPVEARSVQEPIKNFLSAALQIYFKEKCISEIKEAKDDE